MAKTIGALFLVCISLAIGCKSSSDVSEGNEMTLERIDVYPTFPKCQDVSQKDSAAMFTCFFTTINEFIAKTFEYPVLAQEEGRQGKAFISFIIERDGSVSNVTTLRSSGHKDIDAECLRVIRNLPYCQPAMANGKEVRAKFVIPINARLK